MVSWRWAQCFFFRFDWRCTYNTHLYYLYEYFTYNAYSTCVQAKYFNL